MLKDTIRNLPEEDKKRIRKKLKEDLKLVKKGKPRRFYITEYLYNKEDILEYFYLQKMDFEYKFNKELEDSKKKLEDESLVKKYNILSPKVKPEQLYAYADETYPNIQDQVWEIELEMRFVNYEN